MKIPLTDIHARAKHRPPGYVDRVLAAGVVVSDKFLGDVLEIDPVEHAKLVQDYQGSPPIADLVRNFAGAVTRWVRAGLPVVRDETFRVRYDTCGGCEHWHPEGNLGLGKCDRCGCASIKLWMATERCPLGKWLE